MKKRVPSHTISSFRVSRCQGRIREKSVTNTIVAAALAFVALTIAVRVCSPNKSKNNCRGVMIGTLTVIGRNGRRS